MKKLLFLLFWAVAITSAKAQAVINVNFLPHSYEQLTMQAKYQATKDVYYQKKLDSNVSFIRLFT